MGHLQSVSPFLTYLFSQNRQELDMFKRPLQQKMVGTRGSHFSELQEGKCKQWIGLLISLGKRGDQELGGD